MFGLIDLSIAIPTYNGEKRLPQLLEKLRSQIGIENLVWEVLIVDNNSTDNTAKIIKNHQENWQESVPLKYYLETEQGAAFARIRAVQEAKGEWIGFLDDDNFPELNWIQEAYNFAKKHHQAGVIGGQIHGNFEVQPPENFAKIQQFLAIREQGQEAYLFDADQLQLPPGAALFVRRQAWLESVPKYPKLTGKLPNLMIQGDDYEPLLYMHKSGWQIWYNPNMHTYHQIPKWRLERDYLLSIAHGCGLATFQLRIINAKTWQKPVIFLRTFLGNLRRIIWHWWKYRGELHSNLIAAFELEFFWGSLLSVFLLLHKKTKI